MAMRFTARTAAAVAMCAATLLAGCQAAVTERPDAPQGPSSAPVPAAVSHAEVLDAVKAAATLRDLPSSISSDELLAASGDYTEQWSIKGCEPGLEQSRLDDIGPCVLGDTTSARTMSGR
ncbi:hypothetical protein RD149_07945 [Gordonia westfalica]|uniref:PASTA domain-containing protein n=1 Tax=Gordonia westfalica TaxID=158898 RepID=A0ABU2GRI7_9ACTN|nr:hypothetical protein [Gordonia westfalica]MDS1113697.1 hypothetical protein [Gordonia westfalica]